MVWSISVHFCTKKVSKQRQTTLVRVDPFPIAMKRFLYIVGKKPIVGKTTSFGIKQSWTVFIWFFILSGRENSLWQTGQGNTFLWWPSWYKNACLWKLYLFLKVFCTSNLAHSVHWYTPSFIEAYRNKLSPLTDISVRASAGSWLWDVALLRTLRLVGCFAGALMDVQLVKVDKVVKFCGLLVDGVMLLLLLLITLSGVLIREDSDGVWGWLDCSEMSVESDTSNLGVSNFWVMDESVKRY